MDQATGVRPTEPPDTVPPEAPARKAALRPRNAATLILLDRSKRALRILMGRRHPGLAFMPGKFVFPGGRIEPGDRQMPVAGALPTRSNDALAAKVARGGESLGRVLALAAIRETYEETGLLLGTRDYGPPDSAPAGTWTAFREAAVLPDLEALHFVARAITPPGRPRRFDTRFFAANRTAIAHEVPGVVSPDAELVELVWVSFSEARALDLPRITRVVLDDLEAQAKGGFAPYRTIPYYYERSGKPQRETL
jgi:8-oxo-dGTP pyrophosphatase MutT (NUDIX family)